MTDVQSRRFLAAAAVLGMTCSSSGTIGPLLLGLYVDEIGLTAGNAGIVVALEALGYVVAQLFYSFLMINWPRRRAALLAVAIVLGGNFATLFAGGLVKLAVIRFLVGIGMGITYAVLVSSIAGRRQPSRDYAIVASAGLVYAALLFAVSGHVVAASGLKGIIGLILIAGLIGAAAASILPVGAPDVGESRMCVGSWARQLSILRRTRILRLAGTFMLLYAGHNALWAYQERMGLAAGLSPQAVGEFLGLSILAGAIGAGLAALVGNRWGLARPQLLALSLVIVSALVLANGSSPTAYLAAAVVIKVGWFLGVPFLQGALAGLDSTGRALVLAGALQTLGSALGPAAAACVVALGYSYVGWVGITFYLLCIPLCIGTLFAMDHTHPAK